MIFSFEKTYDILKYKIPFAALSSVLVLSCFILLATKGLNFGIDFTGGTVVQLQFNEKAPLSEIRKALKDTKFNEASLQEFGSDKEILIKFPGSTQSLSNDIGDTISTTLKDMGDFEVRRVDIVGPKVGNELREKGISALVFAMIGVLIYIALRFEWRFGLASILALAHDISITLGVLSLFQVTVNLDILAALLTILGYSLNDTIVVFDRVREGLNSYKKKSTLTDIINEAISRTLSRTTLTSLTTFFVVLVLFLFGGELINGLAFTLIIGVIVGTYSSIFIASSSLGLFKFSVVSWREKENIKAKNKAEKDRLRAQYSQGTI